MPDLPPTDRIRLLLELAALRDGVRALVLTSPERHGGPPASGAASPRAFTARGLPVLVIGGADRPPRPSPARYPLQPPSPSRKGTLMTVLTLLRTRAAPPHLDEARRARVRGPDDRAAALRRHVPVGQPEPVRRFKNVPAGIVVADTGSTVDGSTVNRGQRRRGAARRGRLRSTGTSSAPRRRSGSCANGGVDFVVTLPAATSRRTSPPSAPPAPRGRSCDLTTNDANSYLSSTIAGQVDHRGARPHRLAGRHAQRRSSSSCRCRRSAAT